jgi:hypothetical protein
MGSIEGLEEVEEVEEVEGLDSESGAVVSEAGAVV